MNIILVFVALSIVNVVFSTIRTILTIKGGKTVAALVSASYFAFYNIMLIYTVADFDMLTKCAITFGCNLIGVWLVKYFEERAQKEKVWKIECSMKPHDRIDICTILDSKDIPHNFFNVSDDYNIVNIYCATKEQSYTVREILKLYDAKYFVSETKSL